MCENFQVDYDMMGDDFERIMEMTIDDIKALIAEDESRTLEFKKIAGELKDGMHSACAFLNIDNHHIYTNP